MFGIGGYTRGGAAAQRGGHLSPVPALAAAAWGAMDRPCEPGHFLSFDENQQMKINGINCSLENIIGFSELGGIREPQTLRAIWEMGGSQPGQWSMVPQLGCNGFPYGPESVEG